jgi:predicted metal-dependent phosphoesterase TrpH
LIDLHTHSDESDGSWSPSRLVEEALKIGLEALAIADHDTLKGHDLAAGPACASGLDLVCAVEIGTVFAQRGQPPIRHVHVLGYFLNSPPLAEFRNWLVGIQEGRSNRNRLLAERLQSLGLDVSLEEAQALGSGLTGRPHFARVLVRKGYASDVQDAFDKYLGHSGKAYVPRREPSSTEAVGQIMAAGGLAVLAHPGRLRREQPDLGDFLVRGLVEQGLGGVEVYHSDHTAADTQLLLGMAQSYGLAITGGSDFHGEAKPGVELGTGHAGNLSIPREVLERLRTSAAHRPRG